MSSLRNLSRFGEFLAFNAQGTTMLETMERGVITMPLAIDTKKLLIVAGVVWLIAGANIVNIGLGAYAHEAGWIVALLIAGSLAVFVLFHTRIFTKMVRKHAERIQGYLAKKTNVFKFFDAKGYIMMAIMMGGGIALRVSGVIPEWFIAFFYTGLGAALAVAGVSFLIRYVKRVPASCPALPSTWRAR